MVDGKVKILIDWIDEEINLREKEYDKLCHYGAGTSVLLDEIELMTIIRKVVCDIWEVE